MPGTQPSAAPRPLTRRQLREGARGGQATTTANATPETAYPTRRQLREAARVAEQAAAPSADSPPSSAGTHGGADTPLPAQHAAGRRGRHAAPEPGPTTPAVPTPPRWVPAPGGATTQRPDSRRTGKPRADLQDTDVVAVRPLPSRHELRAARRPRRPAAVAGLVAAVVAAPLTGFITTSHSAQAVSPVQPQPSLLDLIDASAADHALTSSGSALKANPTAAVRAAALAGSRASERDQLDSSHLAGANGESAAFVGPDRVVMPLAAGTYRNTSRYGMRTDPFLGRAAFHSGMDFAAPLGTPIYAVADGVVDYAGTGKDGRSSMLVVLRHEIDGEVLYTWYNHMFADGVFVAKGQEVSAGDVIAAVGNNGRSTGPHLHFEVHLDDDLTTTEPLTWLARRGAVDVSELG